MQKSVPELKDELERRTKEALVKQLENVESVVEGLMRENVRAILANALGFSNSFGRWEVDHCKGRQGAIANAIGQAALSQMQAALPDFIEKFICPTSQEDLMIAAGRRDFKDDLRRKVFDRVNAWIEEESVRQSNALIESLKPKKDKGA